MLGLHNIPGTTANLQTSPESQQMSVAKNVRLRNIRRYLCSVICKQLIATSGLHKSPPTTVNEGIAEWP